jgi:hypothetical protein
MRTVPSGSRSYEGIDDIVVRLSRPPQRGLIDIVRFTYSRAHCSGHRVCEGWWFPQTPFRE